MPRTRHMTEPTVIDNYYSDEGPPVVTYYAPPPDYAYLYAWDPFPFWCGGFWFPGYYVLNDFDFAFFGWTLGSHFGFYGRSDFAVLQEPPSVLEWEQAVKQPCHRPCHKACRGNRPDLQAPIHQDSFSSGRGQVFRSGCENRRTWTAVYRQCRRQERQRAV